MAYSVQQMTRAMGIRMAVGAEANDVRNMVVLQGMRLSLAGILIGLAAAFGLSRLIRSLLFGVTASDPAVFVVVPIVSGIFAFLAVWLPGQRATRSLIRRARSHTNNRCNMTQAKVRRASRMPRGVRPRR